MADRTLIEWTDATWNPVTGCSKVSPGCAHCYAERMERRWRRDWRPWTAANAAHNVRLHPDRLDQPLKWRKPRRIFVCSMSDLFHEAVPFEFIDQVFGVMAKAYWHTFQVLTKRPVRMAEYFSRRAGPDNVISQIYRAAQQYPWPKWAVDDVNRGGGDTGWPLPNVWIGVTAEDQQRANERIPLLLDVPAAVHFVSCEPLLGPVDLTAIAYRDGQWDALRGIIEYPTGDEHYPTEAYPTPRVDWVIVGGESGPGARPMHPEWVRSLRDQCQAAGVAFFFKQWGEWLPNAQEYGCYSPVADYNRDHVLLDGVAMVRVGKKAAGRLLDGRNWDEMPGTAVTAP